ncbi:MAG TPA: alpha/beta fold hydrolase [Solirubrobacteraceae bacterium]|jgi:poly(3-hydroxyalkanoate) depolymerase|nr:alpha/beta fold hydrolase [Solirubrobacteraceae bacterium]
MTAAPSWAPARVRVAGMNLRVARRGEGRPLLLLTGIGANLDMWGPFEHLLDGREVIALDAPGTGLSDRPPYPIRMRQLAEVVVGVLDELGVARTDVLGYSFGGLLAQELARRSPERVRRLILCATAQGTFVFPPRPLPALMLMSPARYYHPALFRLMMPRIAGGRTRRDPAQLDNQATARLARPPELIGYAFQLYAASGFTSLPWLHSLRQPTLIIAGDDDPIIPLANARLMAGLIPDARLRIVKGGGHLLLLDEPGTVIDDIYAFLDDEASNGARRA